MYNYPFHSMSTTVQISINHELFANDMIPVYKLLESIETMCSVTARTALEADVLAKTVLLLGEEKGRALIAEKESRAVLINKDEEIWRGGAKYGDV
jgi:hypothetical protein